MSANGRDLSEASKWQALEAIFSYKHAQSIVTLIVRHQQHDAVGFLYSYHIVNCKLVVLMTRFSSYSGLVEENALNSAS